MRSERLIRLVCVLAVVALVAWSAGTAAATTIWSEDFSSSPDLSSGNWHSNITYNGDPASTGTWSTSAGYAAATTNGAGSVSYTASNAQYMFTGTEKTAFGSLYDSGSGMVGGGGVSGTLYVRLDANGGSAIDSFGWFQLRRGSTTTVEELNSATSVNNALNVGKEWGKDHYSGIYYTGAASSSFDLNPHTTASGTKTIVMKISYAAGAADSVSLYLDPLVASESGQPSSLITTLTGVGDLSFDSFLLRCGNQGTNWNFDNVKFGISFGDVASVPEPGSLVVLITGAIGLLAYAWRKRR